MKGVDEPIHSTYHNERERSRVYHSEREISDLRIMYHVIMTKTLYCCTAVRIFLVFVSTCWPA